MSIVKYTPGQEIPYTPDQLNALCLPVTGITPGDLVIRVLNNKEDEREEGEREEDEVVKEEDGPTPPQYRLGSRYGLFYVEDGVLLGVAICSVKDDEADGKKVQYQYISVHVLCVAPDERRKKKVGPELLKGVESLANDLDLKNIRLSAVASAKGFYERNGFVNNGPEDEENTYYSMEKILTGGRRRAKTARLRRSRQTTRRARPRVARRGGLRSGGRYRA